MASKVPATSKRTISKKVDKSPTTSRVPSAASFKGPGFFGYTLNSSLLDHCDLASARKAPSRESSIDAEVHIFGSKVVGADRMHELEQEIFEKDISHWQKMLISQRGHEVLFIQAHRGPVWLVRPRLQTSVKRRKFEGSGVQGSYGQMRDRVGSLWPSLRDAPGLKHLGIFFHGCVDQDIISALIGLELASYRFTAVSRTSSVKPNFRISIHGASEAQKRTALGMGRSMNIARHLVNCDAAIVNPKSYAEAVAAWFQGKKSVTVDVWGPERLRKEGMNLHLAVGQGAVHGSHMVHIRYRPASGKSRFKAPLAIVGKGVTFDTGGLDLKPASGMRLMKKDMGGSASVVGLANWLAESESDVACDLYLGLAENAVDARSFRPGDVLKARNGLTVEIHNTDAEGRLVMADVFDVAQTQTEKPLALIDFSTLTGAMRVAVGVEIAGFFANHDGLAELAYEYGVQTGDPCWRLPLWESYRSQLKSSFADLANASDSGFAGAITAALFLQKFVKADIPWLHFDLYCWADRAAGALGDIGGNGQGIQMMAAFLDGVTAKDFQTAD